MDSVSLQVDPVSEPIDGPTVFRVHGVAPGLPVHLDIATVDAAGHHWVSHQDYDIDGRGVLKIEDPDRPWGNMTLVGDGVAATTFCASDDGRDYRVSVHALDRHPDQGGPKRQHRLRWHSGRDGERSATHVEPGTGVPRYEPQAVSVLSYLRTDSGTKITRKSTTQIRV